MTELHKKRQLWRWNIFIVDCILVELYLRSSHRETWRKRIFMKSAHKMCRFFVRWNCAKELRHFSWLKLDYALSLCFFCWCACAMCMSRAAIHLSIFVCFINIDLYLRNEIVKQRAKYRDVKYGFSSRWETNHRIEFILLCDFFYRVEWKNRYNRKFRHRTWFSKSLTLIVIWFCESFRHSGWTDSRVHKLTEQCRWFSPTNWI